MSSTAEFPAASSRATSPGAAVTEGRRWHVSSRTFYTGLAVTALVVAAISLLVPSTPSYDPWAWIVWGREVVHFNLHTTGGPSWKPLPMIFTTVFALFGKAAPDLWLMIARAGAFAAVVMVFRLSFRLTRRIGSWLTAAADTDRLVAFIPALMAGAIAAVGLVAFSGGFISDNALGYSEGLAAAVILIAVDRHLDGRPRQAFALGFLAALDRPEIWLFWGPYGLWLFWRDAGARRLVIALFLLIPVFWFLPEYWGSGQFFRGVNRARHPRSNSLAFAHCPFCSELVNAAWPTILLRIKLAAAVLVVAVAGLSWHTWRRRGLTGLREASPRAQIIAALTGIAGLAWFVVIATMTQVGFSGNNRYLVIGSALVEVCGAVAWGWAAQEIGNLAARLAGRGRATAGRWLAPAGYAVTLAAFVTLPSFVGGTLISIQRIHRSLVYQAHLRQGVTRLVARYGGPAKVLSCGTVMTEGFQVPMVAWTLGVHTAVIEAPAPEGVPVPPAPNVILQTRDTRHASLLPVVHSWPDTHYTYVGTSGPFRMFTHCR